MWLQNFFAEDETAAAAGRNLSKPREKLLFPFLNNFLPSMTTLKFNSTIDRHRRLEDDAVFAFNSESRPTNAMTAKLSHGWANEESRKGRGWDDKK